LILVTGGAGYIGSHLVRRLAAAGEPVRALVRDRARVEREGRLPGPEVEIVVQDVRSPAGLTQAMQGVRTVIHTVAIAIEKAGQRYEVTNFQGTVNVVTAAKSAGVRRFIHLSQMGADPNLPYRFLASKGRAQAYVAASGLDWTSFRPSVVWGPEDEFANTFARLVPFTPLIFPIVGGAASRFEPLWVEDLVTSVMKVLGDQSTFGQEYELGGPEVLTLEQIERRTLQAIGARRLFVRLPLPALRLVVALMERTMPSPPVTRSLLELLAVSNVTEQNSIARFVPQPRAFTPKNTAAYMRQFRPAATLARYFAR
jgi:NADH dehydrogenase